jgi:hypothetical protein
MVPNTAVARRFIADRERRPQNTSDGAIEVVAEG